LSRQDKVRLLKAKIRRMAQVEREIVELILELNAMVLGERIAEIEKQLGEPQKTRANLGKGGARLNDRSKVKDNLLCGISQSQVSFKWHCSSCIFLGRPECIQNQKSATSRKSS
jgi:hypothetical protein